MRMKNCVFRASVDLHTQIRRHRDVMKHNAAGNLVQMSDALRDLVMKGLGACVGPSAARRMVTPYADRVPFTRSKPVAKKPAAKKKRTARR